jgi:hypothetical protein
MLPRSRRLSCSKLHALILLTATAGLSALHCGDAEDEYARRDRLPDGDGGLDGGETFLPFEAVAPTSYVAKVKNILTGLPPTADEVSAVVADPAALRELVDRWAETPEAKAKLIAFFSNAFQQTQFVPQDFEDQLGGMTDAPDPILPNLRETFGRTALAFAEQNRSFSEVTTTRSFMMTTALMSFYGFIDVRRRDDKGNDRDKLHVANPEWNWTAIDSATRQIPFTSSIDPNSPDHLTFSVPWSKCMPRTYTKYQTTSTHLMLLLFGTLSTGSGPPNCNQAGVRDLPMLFAPSDFTDWRMITIRAPGGGKAKQRFYDLPALRASNELVVDLPRVGFFTTPAFFANWGTNVNNLARVTTNQTLIVALGKSFHPQGPAPVSESGLDTDHSDKTTVCYGCHRQLDPMRLFFRKTYSLMYHEQDNPAEQAVTPSFSFYGVDSAGSTLDDLGAILARHPRFPIAWAQKLCTYADSAPCTEEDPEFLRVVEAFKASGLQFKTLVGELFSSPLVTGAARTKTFEDREVVVSIARHDHFCTAMKNRLGIDACRLPLAPRAQSELAGRLSSNIPGDGYSRGAEMTNLSTAPGLFVRSTVENLCDLVSQQVVDAPAASMYTSANKDAAIADFVSNLMGLTSADPRAAGVQKILGEHYDAVVQGGGSPSDALRSTFVLTCTSPLVTGIGL